MTLKTLLAAGSVAALLAGPALAQTTPSNGETQRTESRQGRAAQTNPNNTQGKANANENAGFGAGTTTPPTGGQDGALREGAQIVDSAGKVIGVVTKVQRTRDGEIRSVTARFDILGKVTLKLVPKVQLKILGNVIRIDLTPEQIDKLQNAID